uniref:Uncharacterized protein n=1 Tax=Bracon brevicornis TaxID=1563983 RepID=A0A6V7IVL9_9HYME
MEDFVPTRCAQVKKNVKDDFVSVTFTAHKKKIRKDDHGSGEQFDEAEKLSPEEQKQKQEKEMKRLRWDIMKFGASGMKAGKKQSAKTALILQLGGIPTKSKRNQNYKEILQRKTKEKARQERRKARQSGAANSLVKVNKTRKNVVKKKEGTILDVYGKVDKKILKKSK